MLKTYVKGTISNCDDGITFYYLPYSSLKFASIFIPNGTEVMVDLYESSGDSYKICTAAGIEGFCLKKYIEIEPEGEL